MTPSLANTRADFIFTGRASHAAASPHLGRSALDAVELMNVGVNYMREHMPSEARVHYALLDTGGIAPNVVQAHARVRYSIRDRDLPGMNELVERVRKIARGRCADDRNQHGDADHFRRLQRPVQHPARASPARHHGGSRSPALRRGGRAIRRENSRHPEREGHRRRLSCDRHGSDRPAAGRFHRAARCPAQSPDRLDRCRRCELGGPDRSGSCPDGRHRHAVPHLADRCARQEPGRPQGHGAGRQGDGRARRQGVLRAGPDRRRQGRSQAAHRPHALCQPAAGTTSRRRWICR